jgi:hypothetical protein
MGPFPINRIFSDQVNTFIGKYSEQVCFEGRPAIEPVVDDIQDGGKDGITIGAETILPGEGIFAASFPYKIIKLYVQQLFIGRSLPETGPQAVDDMLLRLHPVLWFNGLLI